MGGKNSYESIKRYEDKAYDKVLVRFPKGKKDIIKAHAEAHSESVNGFIATKALLRRLRGKERDNRRAEDDSSALAAYIAKCLKGRI